MDWDERVEAQHERQCLQWFKLYREQKPKIAAWVSTFRDGHPCTLIDDCCGSFNWCCKVRFHDGVQWMARFAVAGKAMDRDGKLQQEVAAMRLVKDRTRIPVPTVHAWGKSEENYMGLGPFIIMDYVEGHSLGHLWQAQPPPASGRILRHDVPEEDLRKVYRQIAGYLLDLSKIKFPRTGSLTLEKHGAISMKGPPLTLKIQEIEAHGGVKVGRKLSKNFVSSSEYFEHVADQDLQHLHNQLNSVDDAEDARSKYVFRKTFKSAVPLFVSEMHKRSASRLLNDDFRFGNILVKAPADLTIVAVLDWEWTYTAPFQMFYSPPRWLLIKKPVYWDSSERLWNDQLFQIFLDELQTVEKGRIDTEEKLSQLMRLSMEDGRFWFHELLYACFEGPDNSAWKTLRELRPEIDALAQVSETELCQFVMQKLDQLEVYMGEVAMLGK